MKIFYNILLPVPGFIAMMLFGVNFARWEYRLKKGNDPLVFWDEPEAGRGLPGYIENHEAIHKAQVIQDFKKEGEKRDFRAYCRYYVAYLKQWVRYGYENAPFEVEAKTYARWPEYLDHREPNAWKKYEK